MRTKQRILLGVGLVSILVLCIPAALLLTFAMSPFWSWIERTMGIEAMGHSGPAAWCFGLTYAVLVLGWSAILGFRFAHRVR